MKNAQYFKHDVTASLNAKLINLIAQEGVKGYGTYWLILECLRSQEDFQGTFLLLESLRYRLHLKVQYLRRIIEDYDLFVVEGDSFFSPGMCKRMKRYQEHIYGRISLEKNVKKEPNAMKTNDECADIARKEEQSREDKEKNCSKKEEIADVEVEPERKAIGKTAVESLTRRDPSMVAIRPWEELVDEMGKEQEWMSVVGMHSGMGELFMSHHAEVLALFKEHVRRLDNGGKLLFMHDVKHYFANCFNRGTPVNALIRQRLLEIDKREREQAGYGAFETMVDGKRMYMGRSIPKDAPPRPDAFSVWDEQRRKWIY